MRWRLNIFQLRFSWVALIILAAAGLGLGAAGHPPDAGEALFDLILAGGTVYDGSGEPPRVLDVGVRAGRIEAVGDLSVDRASRRLDVRGLAVAPGFINMLSWATESLLADGRSMSDICQGVTLEVMGEGSSMGPLTAPMKERTLRDQTEYKYEIPWTTLGEYLEYLERRGVSTNVASFVGAATVREGVVGLDDRPPTSEELGQMQALVARAMEEGALGVGAALIYTPGCFASTGELTALARTAAKYDGMFICHLRSEAGRFLEGVGEIVRIARESGVRAEIYHLKAAGASNWPKLEAAVQIIEEARTSGVRLTADMYAYTAGATGLDACMPPWVREGGYERWRERLLDPATRRRVMREMVQPGAGWENFFVAAGSAEHIRFVGFKNPSLRPLIGQTLAAVAAARGQSPEETVIDLVIEDGSRVEAIYFLMSEDNVRQQIRLPWVSFCSDAESAPAEGPQLQSSVHPRAYGNFARLLGRYVREERLIPLEEAVRRLTALPAENLRLPDRGRVKPGYWADLAVFDPARVRDLATYEKPRQLADGMVHVFVNGVQVIADGRHTGATPGRFVRGPGYRPPPK